MRIAIQLAKLLFYFMIVSDLLFIYGLYSGRRQIVLHNQPEFQGMIDAPTPISVLAIWIAVQIALFFFLRWANRRKILNKK
jgi:hypothetical protein